MKETDVTKIRRMFAALSIDSATVLLEVLSDDLAERVNAQATTSPVKPITRKKRAARKALGRGVGQATTTGNAKDEAVEHAGVADPDATPFS